jgi:hypothetical protein
LPTFVFGSSQFTSAGIINRIGELNGNRGRKTRVSSLFFFLGSVANYKLKPLFLVAIAIAMVILSLIFLGTNMLSSTDHVEKS